MKRREQKRKGFSAKLVGCHELMQSYALERKVVNLAILLLLSCTVLVVGFSTAILAPFKGSNDSELLLTQHLNIFADGSIQVDEIIRFEVRKKNTRRGASFDLPSGARVEQALHRVGGSEGPAIDIPFQTRDNLLLVGDPDNFLAPDLYRFYVTYSLPEAIDESTGINELFWPVTAEVAEKIDKVFFNINFHKGTNITSAENVRVELFTIRKNESTPLEDISFHRVNRESLIELTVNRALSPGEKLVAKLGWAREARTVYEY